MYSDDNNVTMCNWRHDKCHLGNNKDITYLLFFQKKANLQLNVKISNNASMKILRMICS